MARGTKDRSTQGMCGRDLAETREWVRRSLAVVSCSGRCVLAANFWSLLEF